MAPDFRLRLSELSGAERLGLLQREQRRRRPGDLKRQRPGKRPTGGIGLVFGGGPSGRLDTDQNSDSLFGLVRVCSYGPLKSQFEWESRAFGLNMERNI